MPDDGGREGVGAWEVVAWCMGCGGGAQARGTGAWPPIPAEEPGWCWALRMG